MFKVCFSMWTPGRLANGDPRSSRQTGRRKSAAVVLNAPNETLQLFANTAIQCLPVSIREKPLRSIESLTWHILFSLNMYTLTSSFGKYKIGLHLNSPSTTVAKALNVHQCPHFHFVAVSDTSLISWIEQFLFLWMWMFGKREAIFLVLVLKHQWNDC